MSALDELFWRDELLQALFWMRGEGLAEAATPADLARFLAADEGVVARVLGRMAEEGYVRTERRRDRGTEGQRDRLNPSVPPSLRPAYRLTDLGLTEGGRRFHDEFAGLTRQAHGECGPGCWCHDPEREGEPCPNRPEEEPERVGA